MTSEEFQTLVLEKLTGLEQGQGRLEKRIDEVESILTTKVEALDVKVNALDTKIDALDTKVEWYGQVQQDDVKGILDVINKKLDRVSEIQIIQGEAINILAFRQLKTESELSALKKAL